MHESKPLADLTLNALLDGLASQQPSPGSGAAGAIALAFAAACAGKAATLSARHRPEDPALVPAVHELQRLMREALQAADEDARAFAAQLKEGESGQLEANGYRVLAIADALDATCIALRGHVIATMTGDLVAAAALVQAGRHVQRRNLAETLSPQLEEGAEVVEFARLLAATGLSAVEVAEELDLDRRMLEGWSVGTERAPRAVELALHHLAALRKPAGAGK